MSALQIQAFFDKATYTLTYVVWDPTTRDAVVIDPVLDYDPAASAVSELSLSAVAEFIDGHRLTPLYILETHAHADHLSGSQGLKQRYPQAKVGISARITEVQSVFKKVFDLPASFRADGSQFDRLFEDGECFSAGSLAIRVLYTPGHTPACASYLIEDAVFTGDALFMPDYGVGRCDFPAGSAETLYDSVSRVLFALPESTHVFTGHDYQPGGRPLRFQSTIGEEKRSNIHINAQTTREDFIRFRNDRDKTLSAPRLLLPSIQVNIDAGHLPAAHPNGKHYLTIPISKKPA